MKIIIVGGVAGGASAAVRLRRLDEDAEIILIEKGSFVSFANCGLPYHISDVTPENLLQVQTPKSLHSRFNIDVRINNEVLSIDAAGKSVLIRELLTGREYRESYDKLILAPGASAIRPGFVKTGNDKRVFSLKDIPDATEIRKLVETQKGGKAVVIGGGFIGLEAAENLALAGMDTTVIELTDHIMQQVDADMGKLVKNEFEKHGVHVCVNERVEEVTSDESAVHVRTDKAEYDADIVILSLGVRPATSFIGDAVTLNEKGAIITDPSMRTSDPDIYAVGDAVITVNPMNEEYMYTPLAGPANRQGRIAADNICGIPSEYRGTYGTSIMKVFDKTVARTGLSEKDAYNYEKSYTLPMNHASYYPGAKSMIMKLIFDLDTGILLGAQIFGEEGVDKRIDVLSTAIQNQMTVDEISELELAYAPPYGSAKDPVNLAAFTADNILTGLVKVFHWHDVKDIVENGEYLLDVRTQREFDNGHIQGSAHVPLDEIRGRLSELPKDRTIYLYCQAGLRAYLACRILSQNGFDCVNLSGGYGLYSQLTKEYIEK
ncbi:MAG: FAD-dependent oxidoreductase [Clostridia bacterium]|nr:FAD-dependent oxidoreductase [Clostridia bacterium]